MTNVEEYELVVLGSGEAGKHMAQTLVAQGQRAAVIERRYVGGSCPNIACLPSKNVVHSAKVIFLLRRGMEFGVGSTEWAVDMAAVRARKRAMVAGLVEMHLGKSRRA
jgi:pyruvate/2-oxoglutarate dehydrogenase complex dihydrolipoamide dehydrogenase (E3) component